MITDILTDKVIKQIINNSNEKEVVQIINIETGKIIFEKETPYQEEESSSE